MLYIILAISAYYVLISEIVHQPDFQNKEIHHTHNVCNKSESSKMTARIVIMRLIYKTTPS